MSDVAAGYGIDVLLIDDHCSFRQAMALHLARQPGFGRISEAGSLGEARLLIDRLTGTSMEAPLVVLLDLHLGDGDGALLVPELLTRLPAAVIVVLSATDDPAQLGLLVEAGASGIVSKRAPIDEIVTACRRASAGTLQIDPGLAVRFMRATARQRQDQQRIAEAVATISRREREVLGHMARGLSDREIAVTLSISYETVRTHVGNVLRKLNVNNRTAAILFAIRHGVITMGNG